MQWRCQYICLVRAILLSAFVSLRCSAVDYYAAPGPTEVDVECSRVDGKNNHHSNLQRLRLRLPSSLYDRSGWAIVKPPFESARPEWFDDSLAPPASHAELSVSVLSSLTNDQLLQEHIDIATTATVGVSLLITFAVMIKATLRTSLSQWMSDSQFVACLSTVVLVSLALCRLQDAYSSQIYAVLQDHASVVTGFASTIALLLALLCYMQGQVVDTLLLPAGAGALDRPELLRLHHDEYAEIARYYGICVFSLTICYQLSYGMWTNTTVITSLLLYNLFSAPNYVVQLRIYHACVFVATPISMLLVANGVIRGRGWANCFMIPTMGAILHDLPSQQLTGSFFHIALLVLKGDSAQVAGSVVLGFVSAILSIRAKTTLLQRELHDKLEQAKLNEAQHAIECMKAKLEGQQEALAQISHLLHSPIAALDYQVRLLNPEEPLVAPIQVCMNLIMEISSLFTQHPELCAKTSSTLDTKQQLSSALPPEKCHASSKHMQVSKKDAIKLRQRGSNLVFMLVDDVQCLRQAQKSHLEELVTQWDSDFVFCEAATGEECISEVTSRRDAPPHAIIIDQYMHDAGGNLLGSATVRQLRHNGFEGLIIGCSGNAECEKLFMDAGADCFWGKPGPSDSAMTELLEHELCLVKRTITVGKGSIRTDRAAREVHDRHQKSVAQIVHDLGTPIQTLKLAFEANDRNAVNISIQTLTQLRGMLVNEAKLSFGESIDPRKDPCNLLKVLEDLKLMMRGTIDSFGLDMTIEAPDTLQQLSINTDASMLMSMLCNLISNAAKHSKSSILVQLCVLEERLLRVQVHDDGLGVPKSFQGQLFQQFQCLQRGDGNTGLGLTSVAAHRCGYDDSLSLVGAMFWFEIPFSSVPTEKQAFKNKASTIAYDVLVVDDSMSLRQTMKLVLEQSGCTVSTAASGAAALAQMQQRHDCQQSMFSVVLCDVQMPPHMSGYEMTLALREWESGLPTARKQPVILMSGDASEAAAQRGYDNGANAYICKPVDFNELVRVLNDVVLHGGSVGSKPAMAIEQLLEEPREVLQLDSTIHSATVVDVQTPNIVPTVEFSDALRLVYGPGVEDILVTVVGEIQEGLAALQSEKTAGAAHKLKGLFGALYLKDAFDECELIHRLCKSQLDGSHEDIETHTRNVVCLFDKSMAGQILPDRERFFAQKTRATISLQ